MSSGSTDHWWLVQLQICAPQFLPPVISRGSCGEIPGSSETETHAFSAFCVLLQNFLSRYKGSFDYWIGLHRESSEHPWKWTDNTQYNYSYVSQCFFFYCVHVLWGVCVLWPWEMKVSVTWSQVYWERRKIYEPLSWMCGSEVESVFACNSQSPGNCTSPQT